MGSCTGSNEHAPGPEGSSDSRTYSTLLTRGTYRSFNFSNVSFERRVRHRQPDRARMAYRAIGVLRGSRCGTEMNEPAE
jgi:hypothetical protein